jgi:quercetin dioxygenase-like cupin family protein
MTCFLSWTRSAFFVIAIVLGPIPAATAQHAINAPANMANRQDRIVFSHNLPPLEGTHLKATVIKVTYGPSESSPPHSHPCAVIGYVIQGAYRTQVKGEAETVYRAGQSFYEAPNGTHMISANASHKSPVNFLVYFVCDQDQPLNLAPPGTPADGGRP